MTKGSRLSTLKIAAALAAAIGSSSAMAQGKALTTDTDALCMFASSVYAERARDADNKNDIFTFHTMISYFSGVLIERYKSAAALRAAMANIQKELTQDNVEAVMADCFKRHETQSTRIDEAVGNLPR